MGLHTLHGVTQLFWLAEIALQRHAINGWVALTAIVDCNQLAQRRQAALQLPTDLTVFAQQQNLHALRPT